MFHAESSAAQSIPSEPKEEKRDEEVLVLGTRPPPQRPTSDPGVAGSTIRKQRLAQPGVGVADALREAPGVQVTQSGGLGAPATARLRGATAAQTPIYLAGVRINDEVGGASDLSTIPTFMLDRVDVYRSHAPSHVSQLGVGGAILFIPKTPTENEAQVRGELGSFGTRSLSGQIATKQERTRLLVAAEVNAAENDYGFDNTKGTLFQSDDDEVAKLPNANVLGANAWFVGNHDRGATSFQLILHHAGREQGAPKLALIPTESARASFSRSLFSLSTVTQLAGTNTELRLASRGLFGSTTLDDPQSELGLLTPRTITPGEQFEQELSVTEHPHPTLTLHQSLSSQVERLRRFELVSGADQLQLSAKRLLGRAAASGTWQIAPTFEVHGVTSLQCVSTAEDDLSFCNDVIPEGRAGLRFNRRVGEVYVSAGRYARLATLSEIYGVGLLVRGNPSLEPEKGTVLETGARVVVPHSGHEHYFWLDASAFARFATDLIGYVRTAQGYLHPINRDTSRSLGGEVSVGGHPLLHLTLEANLSLIDARDTSADRISNNSILPFISPLTGFARAEYRWHLSRVSFVRELICGARASFQSSRYADPAGLGVIPSQFFTDLELGASSPDQHFVLRARVSNLFDANRFDVVGFPLPGRSLFVSLEAKL